MSFYFSPRHQSRAVQWMRRVFHSSLVRAGRVLCGESESCSFVFDSLWPPEYTVRGILQARILECVAFPFSRGSTQPRDQTQVSCIAGGFFTSWASREAHIEEKLGFFKRIILLKPSWFAVVCKFLLYRTVLGEGYLCSSLYSFLHCHLSQDIESSSPCCVVNPYCLSILHTLARIPPILYAVVHILPILYMRWYVSQLSYIQWYVSVNHILLSPLPLPFGNAHFVFCVCEPASIW